ncbi:MAG: hypothetical protein CVU84_12725 [Firmicutes bacterium HGW-Firmicutes-1]|nr:MAG: hypothetical protein CVU84_12725 [Firmicutes bacterium HGW-Firmicutes-1]
MFDEDAFRKIDKQKLEIISKLFNDLNKKNADERLQVLFTYGMEMRSKGLSFTKEESGLLIDLLKVNLNEEEKSKIDMIGNMLRNM